MRLGYACINTELQSDGIFCNRSCVMATVAKKGVEYLKQLALQNLADLLSILIWNESQGIRFFRITSTLFPHMGNEAIKLNDPYFKGDISFAEASLHRIGQYAKRKNHRLTFHMNPFVQLGTPNKDVLRRSIFEIVMYAKIYKAMGGHQAGCVILHGGGVYYDATRHKSKLEAKNETLQRWAQQFHKLPLEAQRIIVLENDERHYGVTDLLGFCQKNKIPFCMDVFHNKISAEMVPITPKLMRDVVATWKNNKSIVKFHLSEQDTNLRFGAHAEEVHSIPKYFFDLNKLTDLDIMIEAKNKEQSVITLYHKYFKFVDGSWKLKS